MRAFTFSAEVVEALRTGRRSLPNAALRGKYDVLWLKHCGLRHEEIARCADVSLRTVQRVLDQYLDGGLAALEPRHDHSPKSELADHVEVLRDHFLSHPPASAAQASAEIEQLTGVKRGLTQTRVFLKKLLDCAF